MLGFIEPCLIDKIVDDEKNEEPKERKKKIENKKIEHLDTRSRDTMISEWMKRFLTTVITSRASDNKPNERETTSLPGEIGGRLAQGGGISKEDDARRGNVRRSKEAVARDPRDRQSQLAQVAGLCPLTQPTISNYVSPRERIYSRQGRS